MKHSPSSRTPGWLERSNPTAGAIVVLAAMSAVVVLGFEHGLALLLIGGAGAGYSLSGSV